jgi:adenosylcobinamide-GDP ribazoletransferase
MKALRSLFDTLGFLTVLPLSRKTGLSPEEFGRLPAWYPACGLVLGLILSLFSYMAAALSVPGQACIVLTVAFLVFLTRGFHLDGLADAADALLSHRSLEEKLSIMKDPRQGTFGVLAIVLSLMLKASLLGAVGAVGKWPGPAILILFPVWGRLSASVVAVASTYVRPEGGLGAHMVRLSGPRELFTATLTSLAISLSFGWRALAAAAAAAIMGLILAWIWKKSLGGITGDLLGASVELGEIGSLLFWAALSS